MIKDEYRYENSKIVVENYDIGDMSHLLCGKWCNGEINAAFDCVYDNKTGDLSLELEYCDLWLIDQDGGTIKDIPDYDHELTEKQLKNLTEYAKELWYKRNG